MTETRAADAATFHVKVYQNTVQVCTDDGLITVQRFDVCGDQEACIEAVDVAVDALRLAVRDVVSASWRYHFRARILESTDGFHR
jgi:hypothetical protein